MFLALVVSSLRHRMVSSAYCRIATPHRICRNHCSLERNIKLTEGHAVLSHAIGWLSVHSFATVDLQIDASSVISFSSLRHDCTRSFARHRVQLQVTAFPVPSVLSCPAFPAPKPTQRASALGGSLSSRRQTTAVGTIGRCSLPLRVQPLREAAAPLLQSIACASVRVPWEPLLDWV